MLIKRISEVLTHIFIIPRYLVVVVGLLVVVGRLLGGLITGLIGGAGGLGPGGRRDA